MDFRIQANPGLAIADQLYKQSRALDNQATVSDEPDFLKTLMEKDSENRVKPNRDSLLSLPEQATLHALFGSEKPESSGIYGRDNVTEIFKGHLLDVAG